MKDNKNLHILILSLSRHDNVQQTTNRKLENIHQINIQCPQNPSPYIYFIFSHTRYMDRVVYAQIQHSASVHRGSNGQYRKYRGRCMLIFYLMTILRIPNVSSLLYILITTNIKESNNVNFYVFNFFY